MAARAALPGVTVTTAGSVAEAMASCERTPPDRMVLLDLMLPDAYGFSGLMAVQQRLPRVPIIIVTARESETLVEAARAVGASGYLYKSLPLDVIAGRLREVDEGRLVFPPSSGAASDVTAIRARIADLSSAQRTVLFALADGRSNKAIAFDLSVTEATVKAHLTAIFRKLGVSNRSQALLAVQPVFGNAAGGEGAP
jgi:DNA-binding NarL/FixJ family response regulator